MRRKKITITIREDVLKKVDEVIDKAKIRNRSHAVEYLLNQVLKPKVNKVYILAGGKGFRTESPAEEVPFSMLSIQGKPVLEHQLEFLRKVELRDILILVGRFGDKIKYHFGDGSKFGVKINYIEQKEEKAGTAYVLNLAKNFLSGQSFLMMYGDVLAEINLKDFIDYHLNSGAVSTVALTSIKEPKYFGVAKIRGGKVVGFEEKPKDKESLSRVISAGIFCFEPKIFNYLSDKKESYLETDIFPKLAKEKKLGAYLFEGRWFDLGTKEVYERAVKEWGK